MGLLSFRKAPSSRKPSLRPNLPVAVPQDDAPALNGAAPAPAAAASAAAVPPIDADTAPLLSLHLLGASDLPRLRHLSNLGKLSPFVVAWVLDHTGARVGEAVQWSADRARAWLVRDGEVVAEIELDGDAQLPSSICDGAFDPGGDFPCPPLLRMDPPE